MDTFWRLSAGLTVPERVDPAAGWGNSQHAGVGGRQVLGSGPRCFLVPQSCGSPRVITGASHAAPLIGRGRAPAAGIAGIAWPPNLRGVASSNPPPSRLSPCPPPPKKKRLTTHTHTHTHTHTVSQLHQPHSQSCICHRRPRTPAAPLSPSIAASLPAPPAPTSPQPMPHPATVATPRTAKASLCLTPFLESQQRCFPRLQSAPEDGPSALTD